MTRKLIIEFDEEWLEKNTDSETVFANSANPHHALITAMGYAFFKNTTEETGECKINIKDLEKDESWEGVEHALNLVLAASIAASIDKEPAEEKEQDSKPSSSSSYMNNSQDDNLGFTYHSGIDND